MRGRLSALTSICLIALLGVSAFAVDTAGPKVAWSYSDYSHGSYVPKEGYLSTRFYDESSNDYAKTYVQIKLDTKNVTNITDYNNGGDNPGDLADDLKLYLTCDVTSVRTGSTDMMDAYSITSTLPNYKSDLENDDLLGSRNEESEVCALGKVESKEYNMVTYWKDYRAGGTKDNGKWQCQYSMSGQYNKVLGAWIATSGDYNCVVQSDVIQATVPYGKTSGKP